METELPFFLLLTANPSGLDSPNEAGEFRFVFFRLFVVAVVAAVVVVVDVVVFQRVFPRPTASGSARSDRPEADDEQETPAGGVGGRGWVGWGGGVVRARAQWRRRRRPGRYFRPRLVGSDPQ